MDVMRQRLVAPNPNNRELSSVVSKCRTNQSISYALNATKVNWLSCGQGVEGTCRELEAWNRLEPPKVGFRSGRVGDGQRGS